MDGCDVGIIGAGVHGAAAAFHLASRGVRTVVLESRLPPGGPTGRSSAVCRAFYTNAFLARVARDSLRMFADFEEVTAGRDAGFVRTGALFLHPAPDGEQLREASAAMNEIGTAVELLDADALALRFPRLDLDGVAFGAWEPAAGHADPSGTTTGMVDRAIELGAVVRSGTTVVAIEPSSAGGATLRCSDGSKLACDRVLIAAGPWTRPLAAMAGADLPLTVERHIVATFGWGGAEPLPFVLADVVANYYLKPEGTDMFGLGHLAPCEEVDPDDFAEEVGDAEAAELAGAAVARIPDLDQADARGGWASLYDVSPDWQPVIGEIADGIVVDAGTSGHGFKLAPALGAHVADLVTGMPADPGIEQFHPSRFAAGRELRGGYGEARILG